MKLIKCNRCGRPYYDNQAVCPFCGQDTKFSASNFITKPVSTPESHHLMEQRLSGKPQEQSLETKPSPVIETAPIAEQQHNEEVIDETPSTHTAANLTSEEAAIASAFIDSDSEDNTDSESTPANGRAEAMANLAAQNDESEYNNDTIEEEHQVEVAKPRKRHTWIWILLIILLLVAAAAYWKWDFINEKINSLLG